jgi:general secretion pathway protein I
MRRTLGFTLLEVMVAVAILALSFTAIFASEAGAIKVGYRARHMGVATLLARCKMAELEEKVAREGLPAVDAQDSDACCEGAEVPGYSCNWRMDRVVLPELSDMPDFDPDDPAAGAAGAAGSPASAASAMGGQGSVQDMLQGSGGPMGDAIAEMAVGFAMPILRPSIEEQVRRATVTVEWQEGDGVRSFDVVQFLVAAFPMGALDPDQMPPGMDATQQGETPGGMPGGGGTQ